MMKLSMKKTLVAAAIAAMAVSGAANAASGTTASTGSSLIFSAWDANGSYSLDLGSFLNTFIGADTVSSVTGSNSTPNSTNTLMASGTAYSGAVAANGTIADIALTGFNMSGAGVQWNMAAGDGTLRKRLLVSDNGSLTGMINSQVSSANTSVGTYLGFGAAASTATGTLATSTDAWYAASTSWGDTLGPTGFAGTANTLGNASSLMVAWQQSITSGNAARAAGFANLTANGQNVTAQVMGTGANSYLHIAAVQVAAVPEADTYAMFLAGLGLMGFIARRRMQA